MMPSRFAVLGFALLALAGCNSTKVNNCPIPVVLADASQIAVFRHGEEDQAIDGTQQFLEQSLHR